MLLSVFLDNGDESRTVLYDGGEKKVHSQLAESQNHLVFRRTENT